jgi:hypothetical protein
MRCPCSIHFLNHSGLAQVGPDNRSVRLKGRRLATLLRRRINGCGRQESVGAEAAASGRLRSCFIASLGNDTRRVPSEWPGSAPRQNTGRLDRCTLALTAANFYWQLRTLELDHKAGVGTEKSGLGSRRLSHGIVESTVNRHGLTSASTLFASFRSTPPSRWVSYDR